MATSKPNKPIDLNDRVSKEDEIGTLIIVLLKARNLNDKHSFRKSDVFAEAILNGTHKRSHIDIKGGQRPEWDSEVRFSVHKNAAVKHRKLEVACYSQEPRSEDLMGKGELDITETLRTGEFDDWVPLEVDGVQRGEIYLEMTYYANAPAPPSKAAPNKMLAAVQNQNGGGLMRRPSKLSPADRLSRPQPSHSAVPQNYAQLDPLKQASHSSPLASLGSPSSRLHQEHLPQLPNKDLNTETQLPSSLRPAHPTHVAGQDSVSVDFHRQHRPSYSIENASTLHSVGSKPGSQLASQPGSQKHSPSNSPTSLPAILRPGPVSGASSGQPSGTAMQSRPTPHPQVNEYGQRIGHGRQASAPSNQNYATHYRTTSQGSNPYLGDDTGVATTSNPYIGGARNKNDAVVVDASPNNRPYALSPPPNGPPLIWQPDNTVPSNSGPNNSFSFPIPVVSPTQDRPQQPSFSYASPLQAAPPLASNVGYMHQQPPPYQYRPSSSSLSGRDWEPDPSKLARYQSPLPLPPGAQPKPAPPTPPAAEPIQTAPAVPPKSPTPPQTEQIIPGVDQAHIAALRRAEEEAARRREQELKDLELAMALDRELNIAESNASVSTLPPGATSAAAMPGGWH